MTGPLQIKLQDEDATRRLAAALAALLTPGDTILLSGEVGSGKSFLARHLIQTRFGHLIEVPSPTFTIVQTYEHPDGDIWHCDLYRLTGIDEVIELGLEDAMQDSICIIEWPDRLAGLAPARPIKLHLETDGISHSATLDADTVFLGKLVQHIT